ncbi:hypothetical protein GXM_00796 [Nostoc sphaeroides CCNUC1]|uniref:Uncharacterized protein n=1 Tax=Nostoc sphaeroides CCNUC1 TaxID=2653204 RepID=A0A5P8VS99_9NOSO|nr:hypothetical protein GXM_00796 [Nostoc sphaeroides CCNUC1]
MRRFCLKNRFGVGWVEERNPTFLGFVGFHFIQPNLQIF